MIRSIFHKIRNWIQTPAPVSTLDGNGERVDIFYQKNMNPEKFDMYQKSHYFRYRFAQKFILPDDVCGDFACGTGYGSMMLAEIARQVIGADLHAEVIESIKERYKKSTNVEFVNANLLDLQYSAAFDKIISFETIEHFSEEDILKLLTVYRRALKPGGQILFSTPYMQPDTEAALKMGFHFTYHIDEKKIESWLRKTGFRSVFYKYQNYETHVIEDQINHKDFIICQASL